MSTTLHQGLDRAITEDATDSDKLRSGPDAAEEIAHRADVSRCPRRSVGARADDTLEESLFASPANCDIHRSVPGDGPEESLRLCVVGSPHEAIRARHHSAEGTDDDKLIIAEDTA